jgi:K+ transporter
MDYFSLFTSQITDIFRFGLLAGLIYTTERTRGQTGILLPLVAGTVFVAVIIPTTITKSSVDIASAVGVGLVANAVIVAVMWYAWTAFKSRQ